MIAAGISTWRMNQAVARQTAEATRVTGSTIHAAEIGRQVTASTIHTAEIGRQVTASTVRAGMKDAILQRKNMTMKQWTHGLNEKS